MRSDNDKILEVSKDVHFRIKKLAFETEIAMKRLSTAILDAALKDETLMSKVLNKLRNK